MKDINLKGVTSEAIIGVIIGIIAVINAVLQMLGYNTLPISNESVSVIVSSLFLAITMLYNAYKNRNISKASQIAQQITDGLKSGAIALEEVENLISNIKAD